MGISDISTHLLRPALAAMLVSVSAAAVAQTVTTVPTPIPGLETFSLPSARPTPQPTPTPSPSPTRVTPPAIAPTVRSDAAAPRPAPRPTATPTPRTTPALTDLPTSIPDEPRSVPVPGETVTIPVPSPSATPLAPLPEPAPSASPVPTDLGPSLPISGIWPWIALGGLLAALAIAGGLALLRRRRGDEEQAPQRDDRRHETFAIGLDPVVPTPEPVPPPPTAPPVVVGRATLEIELIVRRAGTNLLSAAVEYTIVAQNTGATTATDIRLDVRLLSAGPGQDALIAALFTQPIDRPVTTPFDLPPATRVELGGMAMIDKDNLEVMEVAGKALFVPVLTVNLAYGWDGAASGGQTARSYVIGVDRGGEAKLQPFRLDTAPRMYDTVGALDYAITAIT